MAEDQNQRPAPIAGSDRASPLDRVKQVQELQRALEAQETSAPRQAAAPAAAEALRKVVGTFEAQKIRKPTGEVPTSPRADQASYAKAQVNPAKLFGGDEIEVTGNPWKVISFATMLPVIFDPPRPLADYQASVPKNAVKTDEGLLFQVSLAPKDGKEPPVSRAVLAGPGGELQGVESRNASELTALLGRSTGLAQAVFNAAFAEGSGVSKFEAQLARVGNGKRGGYEVTVLRGAESRTVFVNNFGQPLREKTHARAHLDVASYMLDRFEAA